MTVAICVVFALGWLWATKTIAWFILADDVMGFGDSREPEPFDLCFSVSMGLLMGWIWPMLLAGLIAYRVAQIATGRQAHLLLAPRRIRSDLALKEREERIRELERQLGVTSA